MAVSIVALQRGAAALGVGDDCPEYADQCQRDARILQVVTT